MKNAIQLGVLSATNLGMTFITQWYILTELGPSIETDAYIAGGTVPQILLAIISGSLMQVLVPMLAGETKEKAEQTSSTLLLASGILFMTIAALIFISAPYVIPIAVPGFSENAKLLTLEITKINLLGMILGGINCVYWSTLNARKSFRKIEIIQISTSGVAYGLLTQTLPEYGIQAAVWIGVMRAALQTTIYFTISNNSTTIVFNKEIAIATWGKISPLLAGASYYKIDPLVDRALLSNAESGGISLYFLTQQIYGAYSQIINNSVIGPSIPRLSQLHKMKKRSFFRRIYYRQIAVVSVISFSIFIVTVTAGYIYLRCQPEYANAMLDSVSRVWWLLLCLGGMFLGGTLGQLTTGCFYAIGDTRSPTKLGVLTYTVYLPGKILAFQWYGTTGLALSASLFLITNLTLQHFFIVKKLGSREQFN